MSVISHTNVYQQPTESARRLCHNGCVSMLTSFGAVFHDYSRVLLSCLYVFTNQLGLTEPRLITGTYSTLSAEFGWCLVAGAAAALDYLRAEDGAHKVARLRGQLDQALRGDGGWTALGCGWLLCSRAPHLRP